MRIAVFGATGGTGRQVVDQACQAGHEIRAVVRDRSKLDERPGRTAGERRPAPEARTGMLGSSPANSTSLTVVEADVMDPAAITPVIAGCDAVVSALGSREVRRPTTVCADGVSSIVKAMGEVEVRRLVVVSAAGLAADPGDGPLTKWLAKPIVQRAFRHSFDDLRRMEEIVRTSGLDWTIVRPPRLTNRAHTGRYRGSVDRSVRGGTEISRADLATAILGSLTEPQPLGAVLWVAH